MGRLTVRSYTYRQRGDTIVEVLIATVIVATILGGAFVVAQSSSHMVQSSREHNYALQQIQAQTEALRDLGYSGNTTLKNTYTVGTQFCTYVASDNSIKLLTPGGQSQCDSGSNGQPSIYDINVTKQAADPVGLTMFKIDVAWDKLGGGTNHESLVYGVVLK